MKSSKVKLIAIVLLVISIVGFTFPDFYKENNIRMPIIFIQGLLFGLLLMRRKILYYRLLCLNYDLPSGRSVFLVAYLLCLGIALHLVHPSTISLQFI